MNTDVVTMYDLPGVSLKAGRAALASGTGSPTQRAMLKAFFREFDKATAAGHDRQSAIDIGMDAMRRMGAQV